MFEGEIGRETPEWVSLAKALFQLERDPKIKGQTWFDFQAKAQRLLDLMDQDVNAPFT